MTGEEILRYEAWARFSVFAGVFGMMAIAELASPRRPLSTNKPRRWLRNLGLVAVDALLLRLLFPAGAVGLAWAVDRRGFGLLNALELPAWVELSAGLIVLDFSIYLQHVLFHAIPALWRLHMVHHADLDFDLTTGNRFHPIEIFLSMATKGVVIAFLGPPVVAVLAFEALLNATAMFNHGNVRIPAGIDRLLRLVVVTPDMHRVHHSVLSVETNSNFGFNFPWWDRLLGTYRPQPKASHLGMTIGLRQFRNSERLTLPRLLALPFRGDDGGYPLARRERRPTLAA